VREEEREFASSITLYHGEGGRREEKKERRGGEAKV